MSTKDRLYKLPSFILSGQPLTRYFTYVEAKNSQEGLIRRTDHKKTNNIGIFWTSKCNVFKNELKLSNHAIILAIKLLNLNFCISGKMFHAYTSIQSGNDIDRRNTRF
jgi:hypothetical protein